MTVEEMTDVNQNEADRRVRNYRIQKYLGYTAFAVVAIHLFYMLFRLFVMVWMRGYVKGMLEICVLAAHFAVLAVLAVIAKRASAWICGSLQDECDPFLFEACIYHVGFNGNINLKQLNLAIAQYYQGNFQQAEDTLIHTNPESFKKTNRLNYYMLRCALCFRTGAREKVRDLENEFQRRISSREDTKNMQILCAVNNLKRARENKDYASAWRFFYEWIHLTDKNAVSLWYKVGRAWQAALLEEDCADEPAARAAAAYVEKYGNRLMFVKDADRILRPEETKIKGGDADGGTEPERQGEV